MADGHHLAAGVVIPTDGGVVLVHEDGVWSLPKGSPEPRESLAETAAREAREETGTAVILGDVAFVTEYRSRQWGAYLQVYYLARFADGRRPPLRPTDASVQEVRIVPVGDLRHYTRFRPWLVPLEQWLVQRTMRCHFFDLDRTPAELPEL